MLLLSDQGSGVFLTIELPPAVEAEAVESQIELGQERGADLAFLEHWDAYKSVRGRVMTYRKMTGSGALTGRFEFMFSRGRLVGVSIPTNAVSLKRGGWRMGSILQIGKVTCCEYDATLRALVRNRVSPLLWDISATIGMVILAYRIHAAIKRRRIGWPTRIVSMALVVAAAAIISTYCLWTGL